MFSIRIVLFLGCVALSMAHPLFFAFGAGHNREQTEQEQEQEPYMAYPMKQAANQVASPSYDYTGGDGGAGAGGSTETQSASNEVDTDGSLGGSVMGGDAGENEAGENEAAETAAAGNNNVDDAAQAGGTSGAASPQSMDGGPGLAMKGASTSAGQKAGIAVGAIAMVGLAAGIGYFIYRKRREAAYGARF